MPLLHHLLTFAIAAFFIVIIPGPNMTFLITCAATQSRKVATLALLGSNAALITLGILTGLGLSTLVKTVPYLYDSLKIAGAFYFFWLAWKSMTSPKPGTENTNKTTIYSLAQAFRAGYFTNLLNPKAAAFYVAIFPQFMIPANGHLLLQGTMLSMVHALVSFTVNSVIIYSVTFAAVRFRESNRFHAFKKWGSAALFTGFGISILLQKK